MARSTNQKERKTLDEFLISKQLHTINKESCCTTFRTSQGASNIDLTVINNQALHVVGDWVMSVCVVCVCVVCVCVLCCVNVCVCVWCMCAWCVRLVCVCVLLCVCVCVCHHSSPSTVTVSKQYSYTIAPAFPFMACRGTALTSLSLRYI